MQDLTIREYRPADRDRVEAVVEAALRDAGAYFEEVPEEAEHDGPDALAETGTFLVGTLDGDVVATGALTAPGGLHAADAAATDDALELERLHVHPEYQRRGFGRRMVAALERRARERGAAELVLETTTLQSAALAFYDALGFEAVDRTRYEAEGRSFAVVTFRKPV